MFGLEPNARHHGPLRSNPFSDHRGYAKVLGLMIRDPRVCLELARIARAADLVTGSIAPNHAADLAASPRSPPSMFAASDNNRR
jgi:hypothetical protein